MLLQQPENEERIQQILGLLNNYTDQLRKLSTINRFDTTKEVHKALDGFFDRTPEESKQQIKCSKGCTACCYIELDVSGDEAALIINYCKENNIDIDIDYLKKQAAAGRKIFSEFSRCVFLKDTLCSIYPVRPVSCRKHFVTTDPALCDFSKNIAHDIGRYFDLNSEILASAMLNVEETTSLELALLKVLDADL